MKSWSIILLLLVCTATYIPKAQAIDGMALEAGVELPVQIGGRFRLDIAQGIYASVGLGYSPGFMMDLMGSMSSGIGVVGKATGEVMAQSLQDSLYLDARGGYEMESGLYLEAGVSSFQNGGSDTDECKLIEAINDPFATGPCGAGGLFSPGNNLLTIDASLVNLTFHAGMKIEVGKFDLKIEGGLIKPLSAKVNVDSLFNTAQDQVGKNITESYLEDSYTQDMWILSVAAYAALQF